MPFTTEQNSVGRLWELARVVLTHKAFSHDTSAQAREAEFRQVSAGREGMVAGLLCVWGCSVPMDLALCPASACTAAGGMSGVHGQVLQKCLAQRTGLSSPASTPPLVLTDSVSRNYLQLFAG